MKELTDRLQLMLVESMELDKAMKEFRSGLRQQVDSILAAPPPQSLFARAQEGTPLISLSESGGATGSRAGVP